MLRKCFEISLLYFRWNGHYCRGVWPRIALPFTIEFKHITVPFVETAEQAKDVVRKISESFQDDDQRPLVFYTIVNIEVRKIVSKSVGINYNFLDQFVAPLEKVLGVPSKPEKHRTHSIHEKTYDIRIEAVNYALANDDGANLKDYHEADIILVGVSRSGKTPTSLYLALQYGIKAANYPFTEDDMGDILRLPAPLRRFKDKLFGLTIQADRLHQIRSERRANSKYASLQQCRMELREVENLYRKEKIPFLNSTRFSIEEISAKILAQTGLQRKKH